MISIAPAPTFNPMSREDMLDSAFTMPFSPAREAFESASAGFGQTSIGTAVRELSLPPRAPVPIAANRGEAPDAFFQRRAAALAANPSVLSEDQWKTSPYYRKAIPYDPGITPERAAALATQYDFNQARAQMLDRDNWTGPFGLRLPNAQQFVGGFAGQALDPLNYVPVFGPAARAAAIAKFGFLGHVAINASEAALNTAAVGLLTQSQRAELGDDVSWQSQITNIAMGGLIGGVITPIIHGIGAAVKGAGDLRAAAKVRSSTETVANAEVGRAVMNDAVTGLASKGEVELSPAAVGAIERLSADVTARRDAVTALSRETAHLSDVPVKAGEVVISPNGSRVQVKPEVVELADLIRASGDLQVRDRTRAASTAQIEEMATNLDPARLMPSVESDRGAPIVGSDNGIDSGNGRVAALQRAYEAYPDKAAAYRQAIEDRGYSTEGMSQPVLVQRRVTDLSPDARAQFNAEANQSATARMSASELAAMDRSALDNETLRQLDDGPVTSGGNKPFVRRFLANLPSTERAALVDKDGGLNAEGARRIENALVAAAYGDVDGGVVSRFAEATDDNARSIVGAMSDVAGKWALLRRSIKAGDISPEYDMTPELTGALRKLSDWREQAARGGRPVPVVIKEGMAQLDMLDGEMSLEAKTMVRLFYKTDDFNRSAGREVIASRLSHILDAAEELGRPQLFGDMEAATKLGVLEHAVNDQSADLFAAADPGEGANGLGEGGGQRPTGGDRGNAAQGAGIGESDGRGGPELALQRVFPGLTGTDFVMPAGKAFTLRDATRFYTGVGYAQINKWAREGKFPEKVQGADKEMASASIRMLVDNAKPLERDTTVFRGRSAADPETGFRSYSTDRKTAESHATKTSDGVVDETMLPAGTPVIRVTEGGERELIAVPRNLEPPRIIEGGRSGNAADSGRSIGGVMADRFAEAGRPREEADAAGALVQAFYDTMGERLGVDAGELQKRFGLPEVRAADVMPEGAAAQTLLQSTSASQSVVDGLERDAKALSDFLEGQSLTPKRNGNVDVPGSVVAHVLGVTKDEDVLRAIVRALPVDVVDLFARKQLSPELALRDNAMLKDVLSVDRKASVSLGVDEANAVRSLMRVVADAATERADLARRSLELDAAIAAGGGETVSGTHTNKVTETAAFSRWFGKSKVVDEHGAPLVVYHGTKADLHVFEDQTGGEHAGFYFSDAPHIANEYAGNDGSVVPVYLAIKNPLEVDWKQRRAAAELEAGREFDSSNQKDSASFFDEGLMTQIIREAEQSGHDGVIAKNIRDGWESNSPLATSYVAFDPTQIKSVNNRGTFDPNDPRILFQPSQNGSLAGEAGSVALSDQEAGAIKALVDSSRADAAKELADVAVSITEGAQTGGPLSGEKLLAVLSHVRDVARKEGEVLDAVVELVPVDVVDNLFGSQRAAKVALHEEAMLKDGSAFDAELPVAGSADRARSVRLLVGEIARAGAERLDRSARAASKAAEGVSAVRAGEGQAGHPRAAISFGDGGRAVIHLFESADASSILHELGHHFLHMFKSMAEVDGAPVALQRDLETVKQWWASNASEVAADSPHDGVTGDDVLAVLKDGTSGDRVKDLAIDVGFQEQWARGFESYMRDGQAPSTGLAGVFEQFKRWLASIYQSARDLRVNVSPEIKGVFDRLLSNTGDELRIEGNRASNVADSGRVGENVAREPALDFSPPKAETPPAELADAAMRVGAPEDMKALAAQHGVAEDGSFSEQDQIDLLREHGQLSKEDEALLGAADDVAADAKAWGDALMTAARCAFGSE